MITKTGRRTWIRSGAVLLMAAVFLLAMWVVSLAATPTEQANAVEYLIDYDNNGYVEVDKIALDAYNAKTDKTQLTPKNGKVSTASDFCYMMLSGTPMNYELQENFKVTAPGWMDNMYAPIVAAGSVIDGKGKIIWVASTNSASTGTSIDLVGGLATYVAGTIKDVKYYFNGSYYTTENTKDDDKTLVCGGMVGYLEPDGLLENCRIEISGIIYTVANVASSTSILGGVIGKCEGKIENCSILSSPELSAYSSKSQSSDITNCKIYLGGVIGYLAQNGIENCPIVKATARLRACDFTDMFGGISIAGLVDVAKESNGSSAVHPAGGIIGCMAGASYVSGSSFEVGGSVGSLGYKGSSDKGTISGGFIGLLESDFTGNVKKNYFKMAASLSVTFLNSMDISSADDWAETFGFNNWLEDHSWAKSLAEAAGYTIRHICTYAGEWIGRSFVSGGSSNMTDNVIFINGYNDMIEGGTNLNNGDYDVSVGLICGDEQSALSGCIGANNWLVRKLSECDTGRLMGNEFKYGNFNHINVFGDGIISTYFSGNTLKARAVPGMSPFYGWTSNPSASAKDIRFEVGEYNLSSSSGQVLYAMFIDQSVGSSGELTQLANDINLIKSYAWENLFKPADPENPDYKTHFTGSSKITLDWLNVSLTSDILVRQGTPVIEDFYGTFDGNGHTITYAAGSSITHKYEKYASEDGTYEEFATGLFGTIMNGATVKNVNIVFGGSITENKGLVFDTVEGAGDQLSALKETKDGTPESVESRRTAYDAFAFPSSLDLDQCYVYFLAGDDYNISRDYNPGYIEIVPYTYKTIIKNHYVGILAGKNYGKIEFVGLEMTETGYVGVQSGTVAFGGLCGYNLGEVSIADSVLKGHVEVTASVSAAVGGMFGINEPSSSSTVYNALNIWVAGEITIKRAERYHRVNYYQYEAAKGESGTIDDGKVKEEATLPDGYREIACDKIGEKKSYVFGVKNQMAADSYTVRGNDNGTITEILGILAGIYQGVRSEFANSVASSGDKGYFNTTIVNCDSEDAEIGAVIGHLNNEQGVPTFTNVWAAMSYAEFDGGRQVIGNMNVATGVSIAYVQGGIAIGTIDATNTSTPISFTLEALEGKTFAGWYDNITAATKTVITEGMVGDKFTPQKQKESGHVYLAKLINMQIFNMSDLQELADTTNEGRGYEGITFTLGNNLDLTSAYVPIGTVEHPFQGTFEGNGLILTFKGINNNRELIGLFGCVGAKGTVKNIVIDVSADLGKDTSSVAGAVAAVNYGVIGQDSSSGKIIVNINNMISAKVAGGAVGKNYNEVKNVEVNYLYKSEYNFGSLSAAQGGGAIGINERDASIAVAKNIIVAFDSTEAPQLYAAEDKYVLGGVIGENRLDTAAYSLVMTTKVDMLIDGEAGSNATGGQYRGYVIGKNQSSALDALWALYLGEELGDPVAIYNGEQKEPVTEKLVLMNGENPTAANSLTMYGAGNITVSVSGVTRGKGGQITFFSEKKTGGQSFYDYLADFETGERVSEDNGNAGAAFFPVCGTLEATEAGTKETDGLRGKRYYAVFMNTAISSSADYAALANFVNEKHFKAYVNYHIAKSFEIADATIALLGADEDTPFRGSINGNGYTVTMNADTIHAFVGVLGVQGGNDAISNLKLIAQAGTKYEEKEAGLAHGVLTNVNYGSISGVTVYVRSVVDNRKGVTGSLAGKNYGAISSAVVNIDYINYLSTKSYGALYGKVVGGAVGENHGTIGDTGADTVEVYLNAGGDFGGVLYGTERTGALMGTNAADGEVLSATVMIYGTIAGVKVGGAAGVNDGRIKQAFVSVQKDAIYFGTTAFGMIAGENNGEIGEEEKSSLVKVSVEETPYFGAALTFNGDVTTSAASTAAIGGAIGVNAGEAYALTVEIRAPLYASKHAGGIVGENKENGLIGDVTLTTASGATLVAEKAGGVIGEDNGTATRILATLRGNIGSLAAGDKGIVKSAKAGGFAALSNGTPNTIAITLYGEVFGANAGVAAVDGGNNAYNCWIQTPNSSLLKTSAGAVQSGFNAIRVLNDTLLNVAIDAKGAITFTSVINSSLIEWYTNISDWNVQKKEGLLIAGQNGLSINKKSYKPVDTLKNVDYYVCYDSLLITSGDELYNLPMLINNHAYYHKVLFVLDTEINVDAGVAITPIGTEEHPFDGYFDGGYNKIIFSENSILSGAKYTGLFGYTTEESIIRNFILDIRPEAKVGGVNSMVIGSVVGESHGKVQNVFVNLATELISNSKAKENGTVGAFIGKVDDANVNKMDNCWISILNDVAPTVGNADKYGKKFGINTLGVLGNGATEVKFGSFNATMDEYDYENPYRYGETYSTIRATYYVPAEYCASYFGWYSDIRNAVKVLDMADYMTEIGTITDNANDYNVSLYTSYSAVNVGVVLSFISTSIQSAEDFILFAQNINMYGDQGAKFSLDLPVDVDGIEVDFSKCESVGTAQRPFTGVFEGNGKTIYIKGKIVKRDYSGVFGYVGVGGKVQNVHLVTRENVKVGDSSTLYSGIAAAYLRGTLENVVVSVRTDTIVYTTQGIAALGGLVGIAEDGYHLNNSWLVLPEGATVTNAVGEEAGSFYTGHSATYGQGRIMQQVGVGSLRITIVSGQSVIFDASELNSDGRDGFYGFVDNTDRTSEEVPTVSDDGTDTQWTVNLTDTSISSHMLVIFIKSDISSYADLKKLSDNVAQGRNFRGITYVLTNDITVGDDFVPIGGVFFTSSGTGYQNYVECDFIGGFNGKGHSITLPASITARYAGLFGRVGAEARIKNLVVEASGTIGVDTGLNTTRTIYAGVLAAYALGGRYENVCVVFNRSAILYGANGYGRTFGYLPASAGTVAVNCWAICYNSELNYKLNEEELAYNAKYVSNENYEDVGMNQGGVNTIMVIAAGTITVDRDKVGTNDYYFKFTLSSETHYWYDLNKNEGKDYKKGTTYTPKKGAEAESRAGYNVSFLNSEIKTLADLKNYSENINDGYDFYNLTFKMTQNIKIDHQEDAADFNAIGTEDSGLNGTFDGQGYTITLAKDAVIKGKYAGVFGYISENGLVQNVRIVIEGTIGFAADGSENNSKYAGAIAYNNGKLENVLVVSNGGKLVTLNGYGGFVIGYDNTNLLTNVWGMVDASEYLPVRGGGVAKQSAVNVMKIIGVGLVNATFAKEDADDYRVLFESDAASTAPVSGWYKSYEKSQPISAEMLSVAGDTHTKKGIGTYEKEVNGKKVTIYYLVAPTDFSAVEYEVAVIKRNIETAEDLIAIAEDVNVGGYSFKNVIFTLQEDISLPSITTGKYTPIGDETHAFKGTFLGGGKTITIRADYGVYGLFGNNEGEISNLTVVVKGKVGEDPQATNKRFGAVANINGGVISATKVVIDEGGLVIGYTVGGVAGRNDGTVENCLVIVNKGGVIKAEGGTSNRDLYAGGVVGVNYGTVSADYVWKDFTANVHVYGTIEAQSAAGGIANAGGVVGANFGTVTRIVASVEKTGTIVADSAKAENARAGGLVGHTRSAISHNVLFLLGEVTSSGLAGGTAGYLDGVMVINTWQVTYNRESVDASGKGARQINRLNVKGDGTIKATIDPSTYSILFTNVTANNGSTLDGWYESGSVVDQNIGNIGENGNTFLPNSSVQNKYVLLVFVNTRIYTVSDLIDMANSVSGGLTGSDITFELMQDVEVPASAALIAIGAEKAPFNNIFEGHGHKITLHTIGGTDHVGLFGYVGTVGVIQNVEVVVESGNYGSEKAKYTAALAAYSVGTIENVTITVKQGATLVGNSVAALAAASFGKVKGAIVLNLSGTIRAAGDSDVYAGGLIAKNEGSVENVTIDASDASVTAKGTEYSYVGLIAAKNTSAIEKVTVAFNATLRAEGSATTAYTGIAAGINLGKIEKVYIDVKGGTLADAGTAGGFVGNNANAVLNSFLKLIGTALGADSAFGRNNDISGSVYNVWVYTDSVVKMSQIDAVNCIAADGVTLTKVPSAEDVLAGNILFKGDISKLKDGIAVFARVVERSSAAGSGAINENVTYGNGTIDYTAVSVVDYTDVSKATVGVKMLLTVRNTIGSGEELAAFAAAVNSGKYTFAANTKFAITKDIELAEGAFTAIGTVEHPLTSAVTVEGGDHVISVGKATITGGVFGVSAAKIENIGLRLSEKGKGTLVKENNGEIKNVALYLDRGAAATTFFTETGSGKLTNAWVVSYDAVESTTRYAVMKINGVGTVRMSSSVLVANSKEQDIIFIGFADTDGKILKPVTDRFVTAERAGVYTAEFISTLIDTEYKLRVLSDATDLGYDGEGNTFTIGANIEVTSTLMGFSRNAFKGNFAGGGYSVVVNGAVTGSVFGKAMGAFSDLIVDLSAASEGLTLFARDSAPALVNVIVAENRDDLYFGGKVSATNVYVQTTSLKLFEKFTEAPYTAYSVIYQNAKEPIAYTFVDGITAVAKEDASQVFAGWIGDKETVHTVEIALSRKAGTRYTLNFIDRTLKEGYDLVRLSMAVEGGFTFKGEVFKLDADGFTVDEALPTIGSAAHPFEGSIHGVTTEEGDAKSEIIFTAATNVLFYELRGSLKDIIFTFKDTVSAGENATVPSLVYRNIGLMSAIVVVADDAEKDLFAGGAGLSAYNEGEMNNCWFLTKREGTAAVKEGSQAGVNELRALSLASTAVSLRKAKAGTEVVFRFLPTEGSYITFFDEQGKFPASNYSYAEMSYVSPATALLASNRFVARSRNSVSTEDELKYLEHFTTYGHFAADATVTLANDLTVSGTRSISVPLGYKSTEKSVALTFDLNGYTLTLQKTDRVGALFTAKDGVFGTVKNGVISVESSGFAPAVAGTSLTDVALHLPVKGVALPQYNVEGTKIVTPVKAYHASVTALDGEYAYYYYQSGAAIAVEFEDGAVIVKGATNDDWTYGATMDAAAMNALTEADRKLYGRTDEYASDEWEILYAPKVIKDATDYALFALATEKSGHKFAGESFVLGADITLAEGFRVLRDFKGALSGGHTVTISGGAYASEAVFTAAEGGKFSSFVLAFSGATVADDKDMIAGDAENVTVIVYQTGSGNHTESTVRYVNVYGKGELSPTFTESGTSFSAEGKDNYALYSWEKVTATGFEKVNADESTGYAKATYASDDSLRVTFATRYLFEISYTNRAGFDALSEKDLAENQNDLPRFTLSLKSGTGANQKILSVPFAIAIEGGSVKATALCFDRDVKADGVTVLLSLSGYGNGFMFWGLTGYESVLKYENAVTYTVKATAWENSVIPVSAEITYIQMKWSDSVYNGSQQTLPEETVIGAIRNEIDTKGLTAKYTCSYTYRPLGDTPPLVGEKPYHAGDYLVIFEVEDAENGNTLCYAYSGLHIKPIELAFESVEIESKEYDGTTKATMKEGSLVLKYMLEADKAYIETSGLSFEFFDANAGVDKAVRVSGKGSLAATATADKDHIYTYLDYAFNSDAIKSEMNGAVKATIRKKELKLTIASQTVDYLSQFGEKGTAFKPTAAEGLVKTDEQVYADVMDTILTRETPNKFDVGSYRIIVNESGDAFEKLSNYEVKVMGSGNSDAYYTVTRSLISVKFKLITVEYGTAARITAADYTVYYNSKAVTLADLTVQDATGGVIDTADELRFENVTFLGALIPSENEYYAIKCLFSAENTNYQVSASLYEYLEGKKLPVLSQSSVLKVNTRTIKLKADSAKNQKNIGESTVNEKYAVSLMNGYSLASSTHKLKVTRAAGEVVGSYELKYDIVDGDGASVKERYKILTDETYLYKINPVAIKILPGRVKLTYGDSVSDKLKYDVVIGDGNISLKALYNAINYGNDADTLKTSGITLADVGVIVTYTGNNVPSVGSYDANLECTLSDAAKNYLVKDGVTFGNCSDRIEVNPRYLTVTIASVTKIYDGTDKLESAPSYNWSGLVAKDVNNVTVRMTKYQVIGGGENVGSYKIDGTFEVVPKNGDSSLANNYQIRVVQGTLTVDMASVDVVAEVGYFDENGKFTSATIINIIKAGDEEIEDVSAFSIYYGDTRAVLRFRVKVPKNKSAIAFMNLPSSGTDWEISNYVENYLNISYTKLAKLPAESKTVKYTDKSDANAALKYLGIVAANNNVEVNFTTDLQHVLPVKVKVTIVPTEKTIGENDPEIKYELTAYDPNNNNEEIPGYFDYAGDSYSVTITADRTQGESLGKYALSNVQITVSNAFSGEDLMSYVETDDTEAVLIIKNPNFLETTVGKWVVYGGIVAVTLGLAIFLILYFTVLREKWKNKPKKEKKRKKPDILDEEDEDLETLMKREDDSVPADKDAEEDEDEEGEDDEDDAAEDSAASDAPAPEETPAASEEAEESASVEDSAPEMPAEETEEAPAPEAPAEEVAEQAAADAEVDFESDEDLAAESSDEAESDKKDQE